MKKIFTFLLSAFSIFIIYSQTIYSENMGTTAPSSTPYPTVAAYTGYQNIGGAYSYSGTADVRATTVSPGSGSANVYFASPTTTFPEVKSFTISGIDTSAYSSDGLVLSFYHYKSSTAANNSLTVEVSSDGTNWTQLSYSRATGTGTASWLLVKPTGTIPSTSNLRIRFTNTTPVNGSVQYRIDDVKLEYISTTCTLIPGTPTTLCDANTTALDTYTATIPFTGGGNGAYTITPTSGTVSGDNPSSVVSGNIKITGITEGVNNTIIITGGTCNYTIPITAPVCKAINTLPFNEHFDYNSGDPLTAQQTWTLLNSGDNILVNLGSLNYSGITSSGNSVIFSGDGAESLAPFTSVTSGVVSAEFLFSSTDFSNVTAADTYFALFTADNSGNTSNARIWIKKNGTQYQFGLGAGNAPDTWSSNLYDVGTTQYLTLSYDFASNKLYLFENQKATAKNALATPSVTVTPTTAYSSLGGFELRQDAANSTPTIVVDELNINTTALVLGLADINSIKANFIKNTVVTDEITFGAKANVKVYNMNGQLMKSASVEKDGTLNVSSLVKGTYVVAGEVNGQKVAQKIIKQ